jgi:hypothetical protein
VFGPVLKQKARQYEVGSWIEIGLRTFNRYFVDAGENLGTLKQSDQRTTVIRTWGEVASVDDEGSSHGGGIHAGFLTSFSSPAF